MDSLPTACKENDWLGFCPSAVKLQNGDKKSSLKKRTDYHDSFAATGVSTFRCSEKGCAFQGHVSVDFVWKAVMKDAQLGLQCRWAFLAKSHVFQTTVHSRQYQYQCPICIFSQGHAEGRVWNGTANFLEHVAAHRGKDTSAEVLHKLNINSEYVAAEEENFDINLFPPGFDKRGNSISSDSMPSLTRAPTHTSVLDKVWSRKESVVPHAANQDHKPGMARRPTYLNPVRERADSVLTVNTGAGAEREVEDENAEPWTAGLSEFHRDREIDYLSADF